MADSNPPDPGTAAGVQSRNYGAYQLEIYGAGILHNRLPTITTDSRLLEDQARAHMSVRSFNYVAGGAGERATMDANRAAFRSWKMIPRMLRDTTRRDLSVEILGEKYDTPLFVAPVGVQSIFHEDKEIGMAEVAADIGVPYILSTASSSTIEEVAEASKKGGGKRWFQLYWPQNDEVTVSLLNRAKSHGYTTLVVTLDTWALSWRPADLDKAFVPFMTGTGNAVGFSDPVFRRIFEEKHSKSVDDDLILASREWIADVFSGKAHTWDQIAFLKKHWSGPILLKGIQHPDDARMAIDTGVNGIIVSNHGGRQLDGAIGSLTMLPEIVAAVRELKPDPKDFAVLFDSGIRTGVDIIKALCLGAQGVLIGRPWVYGLGIAGKRGARDVLKGLLADLDQSMGLSGIKDVKSCTSEMLRKMEYAGDGRSSN